jgi:phosphoglycerol transferase MdoB-like AlkP superfamily enzyme
MQVKNIAYYRIYWQMCLQLAIVLLLFFLCRLFYFVCNADIFAHLNLEAFLIVCKGGLKFDVAGIIYVNLVFIILTIIPFSLRYSSYYLKIRKYLFIVTNALAIAANLIDTIYFKFTFKRSTFSVFKEFSNEDNKLKLLIHFLGTYWYLVIVYILMLYLLVHTANRLSALKKPTKPTFKKVVMDLTLLVLISGLSIAAIRGGFRYSTRPITLSNAGEYATQPKDVHLILNTPFCLIRTINVTSLEEKNYYSEQSLEQLYTPVKNYTANSTTKNKNVVVIILESFGKECMGFFNKDLENGTYKGFTPFLDSLCGVSTTFEHSYANGRKSIEALPSIFASIPSIKDPFVLTNYFDNKITSLPGVLQKEGYHTSFFHGAPNGSMGFSSFVKMAGVQHYFGKTEFANDKEYDGIWGIWDKPFFNFFEQKINSFPTPFFTSIFSVTSHDPFKVPKDYENILPNGKHPFFKTAAYADKALQHFFTLAAKEKWFTNTIFIITADHSQGEPVDEKYKNQVTLFSIPIIIYEPTEAPNLITNTVVQQTDIMPIVLNKINYNKPFVSFGFDVFKEQENFTINYIDNAYQMRYKDFCLLFDGQKTLALYNVKTDASLKNNLATAQTELRIFLENKIKAFIQQYHNRLIKNQLTVQ